jgi:hypothetical protein
LGQLAIQSRLSSNLPFAAFFSFFYRGTPKEVTEIGKALNFHDDDLTSFYLQQLQYVN